MWEKEVGDMWEKKYVNEEKQQYTSFPVKRQTCHAQKITLVFETQ